MNRTLTLTAAATLGVAALTIAAYTTFVAADTVTTQANEVVAGFEPFRFEAAHHDADIMAAIWYPAQGGGTATMFAENPVFYGVPVIENAPLLDGEYPVVILSHGMGGLYRSMAWLGAALAERGAIVIAVNHPNSSYGSFDIKEGMNHWTRAQDLSAALDFVMADPRFADHIDTSRIMAAGFSYGGWTALSLGGLLGDHAAYVDHCETYIEASSHCTDLLRGDVQIGDVDPAQWNASYADPRITHVTAVDPALIWGMEAGNIENLVPNLRLIALGDGDDRLFATDFDVSGFADLVPNATIDRITPASHFMFLPLCKPAAEAILIAENDDPVCTDPIGADRTALHDSVVADIADDLRL